MTKYETLLHILKHGTCFCIACRDCPFVITFKDIQADEYSNCTLTAPNNTDFRELITSLLKAELMNMVVEDVYEE